MLPLGFGAAPAFGGAGADKIALRVGKPAEEEYDLVKCWIFHGQCGADADVWSGLSAR
jgi:hypothetical protein